ncbi:MAG: AAA family ATPase [Gammaproteobacteria bacterium]|jgi:predicted kinase|nr:AAA family ATPase [Gammaproteobacteria bacterium]
MLSTYAATLFVFSGLPGTGKSTIAQMLSIQVDGVYLRIDTIEQTLRDLCQIDVEGEGYRLSYRIAQDNLKLGRNVVADSCNPIELTRSEWINVASEIGCRVINIELVCSDSKEHRQRVEKRNVGVANLVLPTWQQVEEREYHPWTRERIVVDTAGITSEESFRLLLDQLNQTE